MEVQQKKPVCPESTIESAAERNPPPPKKVVPPVSISNEKSTLKGEKKIACESNIESSLRRDFIKKAALLGAAAAVGGTILGSKIIPESSARSSIRSSSNGSYSATAGPASHVSYCCPTGIAIEGNTCSGAGVVGVAKTTGIGVEGTSISGVGVCGYSCSSYGVKGCSSDSAGVYGHSGFSYGVEGCSVESTGVYGHSLTLYGVYGKSCCNVGVEGYSPKSTGVYGRSCCSYGVQGYSESGTGVSGCGEYGVKGKGSYVGVCATSCNIGVYALGNTIAVRATAKEPTTIPLVVCGLGCANLQEWNIACAPASVVNKSGWLGLGRPCAPTTLAVAGSVSAKVASASSNYSMSASDFGVLANATSAGLTVTLPAASTALGMIVFIKKVDSSAHAVTVHASGSNLIEGESSQSLSAQFASLTLISDGSSNWYVFASDNVDSSYGRA